MIFKNQNKKSSRWKATDIRFKLASEHSINGRFYPCEMQIIHSDGDSKLGVSIFLSYNGDDVSTSRLISSKNINVVDEDDMFESDDGIADIFDGDAQGQKKYEM